jgi:hypothetical protein
VEKRNFKYFLLKYNAMDLGENENTVPSDEQLNNLLKRVEKNEDDWECWLSLTRCFLWKSALDESLECCNMFQKKIGKSFETTLSLKDKKTFAHTQLHIARELLKRNVNKLANQNMENYSNSHENSRKLYYSASKIYTNFYDEQIELEKTRPYGFHAYPHRKLLHVWRLSYRLFENKYEEESEDTYEIIDGHPIYYLILSELYIKFGLTYERLSKDIKNKLL